MCFVYVFGCRANAVHKRQWTGYTRPNGSDKHHQSNPGSHTVSDTQLICCISFHGQHTRTYLVRDCDIESCALSPQCRFTVNPIYFWMNQEFGSSIFGLTHLYVKFCWNFRIQVDNNFWKPLSWFSAQRVLATTFPREGALGMRGPPFLQGWGHFWKPPS